MLGAHGQNVLELTFEFNFSRVAMGLIVEFNQSVGDAEHASSLGTIV